MYADAIKTAIARALSELGVSASADSIPLEFPQELSHGDYATSVALKYAKELGTAPRVLAGRIAASLIIEGVDSITIAGPGFINFKLSSVSFAKIAASAQSDAWGRGDPQAGKTILMEYTDPNPFKEFHIGHLMTNAIGESIARILSHAGAKVLRANYQGDVGLHVAKSIYVQLRKGISVPTMKDLATAYPEGSALYENDPEAKQGIDALNKVIYEKSDAAVNALYEKGRALSLDHFESIYQILGTKFDFYFFESVTGPKGIEVVKSHPEIFEESEGAVVFKGEKYGLHTRVFINRTGLPTYETKEIGLALLKEETCDFDLTITVTAVEQDDFFKVTHKAIELCEPSLTGRLSNKAHGMMRFADGKMSSRTGNVITGESLLMDVIEEAKERAKESRASDAEALAEEVAVAAIKFQILRQTTSKDIIFDRERSLSLEGDSGPYLQYAHARCCAILEKGKGLGTALAFDPMQPLNDVTRFLLRFPEECARSACEREPHYVIQYLITLAGMFNSWYGNEIILDGGQNVGHKLAIVDGVRNTLKTGLYLMGAKAPIRM